MEQSGYQIDEEELKRKKAKAEEKVMKAVEKEKQIIMFKDE